MFCSLARLMVINGIISFVLLIQLTSKVTNFVVVCGHLCALMGINGHKWALMCINVYVYFSKIL